MKQYTQEEIDFLQRSLNGENVEGYIPEGNWQEDMIELVNQGKLKPKSEEFEDMCIRQCWSSSQSKDHLFM